MSPRPGRSCVKRISLVVIASLVVLWMIGILRSRWADSPGASEYLIHVPGVPPASPRKEARGHASARTRVTDGETRDLRILVTHEAAGPIVGATITRVPADGNRSQYHTDRSGRAECEAFAGDSILVEAAGYKCRSMHLEAIPDSVLEIQLLRGHSITGMVVTPNGIPVGSGVTVQAFQFHPNSNGAAEAASAMAGSADQHVTATAPDGSFSLDDLGENTLYSIACGGGGYLQPQPVRDVPSDCEPVRIEVMFGFWASVCFQDQQGSPVPISLVRSPASSFELGSEDPTVRTLWSSERTVILAEVERLVGPRKLGCETWVCASRSGGPYAALFYAGAVPGFEPTRVEFRALPIGSEVPEVSISLRNMASGRGSLEVEFVRASGADALTPDERTPRGILHLSSDEQASLSYPLLEGSFGSRILTDIPYGAYYARFVAGSMPFIYPSEDQDPIAVSIDKGDHELTIVVPPTGGIDAEVIDESGGSFRGDIVLHMGRPPEEASAADGSHNPGLRLVRQTNMRTLTGPPFILTGLVPGDYYCALVEPFRADGEALNQSTVTVRAGEISRVRFRK